MNTPIQQMNTAIQGMCCGLLIALVIATPVGAVLLRAAIAFYNKMAGGAASLKSVPEPGFAKAMKITFVTNLVQAVIAFAVATATIADTSSGAQLDDYALQLPRSRRVSLPGRASPRSSTCSSSPCVTRSSARWRRQKTPSIAR